jgi:cell division protein FtsB
MSRNRRTGRRTTRNTRGTKRWGTFLILLICTAFLCFLAVDSYRFIKGLQYWQRNREIKQGYVQKVERLQQEQQRLKEEIDKLEHNVLSQERLAREMGYIKPGEIVYKFAPTE